MKEISLNILDIAENSVKAGACKINLTVDSREDKLVFIIEDNGCGMSRKMLENVCDPFTTSRTTRKIGLGLPLLKEACELTGGSLEIESEVGKGTSVKAIFDAKSIDCPPLGDMPLTVSLIIQSLSDETEFSYTRLSDKGIFSLSTAEIKEILGSDISLKEPEILLWIQDYIREAEQE